MTVRGGGNAARQLFRDNFDDDAELLVRAPGRVNVIGDHTDYNDGFVLPAAIDRDVAIALSPTGDQIVEAVSDALDEPVRFDLRNWDARPGNWGRYLQGVMWALADAGIPVRGWRGCVTSTVPVGAGLSSSAALELAVARAVYSLAAAEWDPRAAATSCQKAENEWVGVNSGIMDQLTSAAGVGRHALLIDCRSLNIQPVPVPEAVKLVVLDTSTRRELHSSGYNDRRRECEAAALALGVQSLRDASAGMAMSLDGVLARRARHVITENERTLAASDALRAGDAAGLGQLMTASHRSLRDDFDVSSDELNTIVDIATRSPGCYGARVTGGGFAGCAVALVATDSADDFSDTVARAYYDATGLTPQLHACVPAAGAGEVLP